MESASLDTSFRIMCGHNGYTLQFLVAKHPKKIKNLVLSHKTKLQMGGKEKKLINKKTCLHMLTH